MTDATNEPRTRPLCPICRRDRSSARYRPFCSKRCADVDLGRWLDGRYAMPDHEGDDERNAPGGWQANDNGDAQ